jgi:hypothetical protein
MTESDYWSEVVPCSACPEGHDRMTFHSLGMVCARCNEHTGNNHQGHYWRFCKRLMDELGSGRDTNDYLAADFHFCCPDDCELA